MHHKTIISRKRKRALETEQYRLPQLLPDIATEECREWQNGDSNCHRNRDSDVHEKQDALQITRPFNAGEDKLVQVLENGRVVASPIYIFLEKYSQEHGHD